MPTKRDIKIFREFRTLKKNRQFFTEEQYVKELHKLLEDINANIAGPKLSELEMKKFLQLLNDKEAT